MICVCMGFRKRRVRGGQGDRYDCVLHLCALGWGGGGVFADQMCYIVKFSF